MTGLGWGGGLPQEVMPENLAGFRFWPTCEVTGSSFGGSSMVLMLPRFPYHMAQAAPLGAVETALDGLKARYGGGQEGPPPPVMPPVWCVQLWRVPSLTGGGDGCQGMWSLGD